MAGTNLEFPNGNIEGAGGAGPRVVGALPKSLDAAPSHPARTSLRPTSLRPTVGVGEAEVGVPHEERASSLQAGAHHRRSGRAVSPKRQGRELARHRECVCECVIFVPRISLCQSSVSNIV